MRVGGGEVGGMLHLHYPSTTPILLFIRRPRMMVVGVVGLIVV